MSSLLRDGKQLAKRALELGAAHFGPQRRPSLGATPRLWVLMYHRILPADDPRFAAEEPGMIVTPDTFRQQLRQLKQLFTVLPLHEWVERAEQGAPLPARACAITFDDGWRDNFEFALPILQQEQLPATVFVVSHMIGTSQSFWPNRLSRVLAAIGETVPDALRKLPALRVGIPADREALAMVIAQSKALSDDELLAMLDDAEMELGLKAPAQPDLMDWQQVRAMSSSGLIDIGSHTCRHRRLKAGVTPDVVAREVMESRERIAAELGRPVELFCFPNGDVSNEAAKLVRSTYRAAVTTQRGINRADADRHGLKRIGIHEEIGNTPTRFAARLSGWL